MTGMKNAKGGGGHIQARKQGGHIRWEPYEQLALEEFGRHESRLCSLMYSPQLDG